jgi:PKD repeat protein
MATGGLVHPIPALKERPCTDWAEPVDLTTVLTPGVTKSITFPPAEFVRDDSYFFLENEDRPGRFAGANYVPGERLYLWSAGSGFDERMPGAGLLVLHADANSSNSDAIAQQQRNGARPAYRIVQADGLNELRACTPQGPTDLRTADPGDPFPGDTDQTAFDCGSLPASEWYTDSSCTGLEISSVALDDNGSVLVTMNWTPTSIPSLRFIDPPGGVTVGNPPNSIYNVRAQANDVFGGTRVRFFYTTADSLLPDPTASTSHAISLIRKTVPGVADLSTDWNVSSLADGRYYLFADLIPAAGADGTEAQLTDPRPGRNNEGTASLGTANVEVSTSTLNSAGQVDTQGRARSETWTMHCINSATGEWVVNSSLSLPDPPPDAIDQDPYTHAITGQRYVPARCTGTAASRVCTNIEGVAFTIQQGAGSNPRGAVGDTFTFTTTGITARSEGITIRSGRISEDPVAAIDATPLSGLPPLTVSFDARRSVDPNGAPLTYRWTFGDGSAPASGAQVTHNYADAGTFTATLRATNGAGRFGETSVDIRVINNTPNAVIRVTPNSGLAPLVVSFSASQSSDAETSPEQLVYQWEFGDGSSANDARVPGLSFREVTHTYARRADGTQCSVASPCTFTAKLTVTDAGGVSNSATTDVRIGNTNPVPNVTFTSLTGATPLTVTFNAKNSTDAENDPIEVEWIWGDGTANETYRALTGKAPATDGSVPHTFLLPAGATTRSFTVRAILRDLTAAGVRKGGEANWPGVTVTVTALAPEQNHPPTARFTVTPEIGLIGEDMTFDASTSTDADGDDLRYRWDFGDGTTTNFGVNPIAVHAFDEAGNFTVRLTVEDEHDATATAARSVRVLSEGTNRIPTAIVATGPRTGPAPLSQTFDGRLSFDPDGDALSYSWAVFSNDLLIDTLTGQVATRVFTTQGTFTVTLTVRDVRGGEDVADPVTVVVAGEVVPPVEPEPPRPEPEEPPDSANQRPTPVVCGLGMVGALLGMLTGLGLTAVLRRRRGW